MSQKISPAMTRTRSDQAVRLGMESFEAASKYQGLMIDFKLPTCPECGKEADLTIEVHQLTPKERPIFTGTIIGNVLNCIEHGRLLSPMVEDGNYRTAVLLMNRRRDELPISALPKGVSP